MYHFLLIYLRNIRNNSKTFLINISSFSIGIVAVMFIYLFVVKEFSTDRFHTKHKDIYRVLENRINAPTRMSIHPFPMGNLLASNHSEIQDYTRFIDSPYYTIKIDEKQFLEQKISFVDHSFFKMFDFTLDVGDYNKIFENPNAVIIDRETAKRYFHDTDVVGKTFEAQIPGINEKELLTVVGILSDYPEESTIKPEIIADIKSRSKKNVNNYFVSSPQLFLYIPNTNNIEKLTVQLASTYYNKLNALRSKKYEEDRSRLNLQRLSDIYLNSSNVEDKLPKGDFIFLWVLICVGVVLLIVTYINYIILTLGLRLRNQKQNEIHKVLGGSSGWLKKKYITESVFYTIVAFILAILLLPIVQKVISEFSDYRYSLFSSSDMFILSTFSLIIIVFSIVGGFVQYLILDLNKKSEIERIKFDRSKASFKYLVPFQLSVFIITIIALILVTAQIRFIKNQDLGFNAENTYSVMINDDINRKLFIQEFGKLACVENFSVGHVLFNNAPYLNEVTIDDSQRIIGSQTIFADHKYIETYKILLLYGTNINGEDLPTIDDYYDYQKKKGIIDILVNEEFVRKSELADPLGSIVTIKHNGTCKGRITGIIADVRNLPFYESITPMVLGYGFSHLPSIIVRVKEGHMEDFKIAARNFFRKIGKESYFGYGTYSYDFENWYKKEQTLMSLLVVFSVVTLFILILGLIGVSLFIAERKTKEIGIRKVNGAKVSEILAMLNKDFVKWVVIAFVIATPIAHYAMNKWLENFAYKTNLSWWIFALAGLLALGIALLTVSWQSWKAATRNPVEALRYE